MVRFSPILLLLLVFLSSCSHQDWRTLSRESAGIAPDPVQEKRAVVQIYAARAARWRGYFGVHSWIATKKENADSYTVYQVIGFRLRHLGTSVIVGQDDPDRFWFGSEPDLIDSLVGQDAAEAIPIIEQAVKDYPYWNRYRVWPGPNSNTFVSYIIRKTPQLRVELPPHAIGRDFLVDSYLVDFSESQTGIQFSIYGLLGFTVGAGDGVEFNLLGMCFGVDFWTPALKLPFIGRLGFDDAPVF